MYRSSQWLCSSENDARALRQTQQLGEPTPLLLGDLGEEFLLGHFAVGGQTDALALEVEFAALLEELAHAHERRRGVFHPRGVDELAHALAAPAVFVEEHVEVFQPQPAGLGRFEEGLHLVRRIVQEDAVETHGLGLLAEAPQLLVDLEHLVVEAGEHPVELGIGVVDVEHLLHHGFEEHVDAEDHIHEVEVDLPHAPVETEHVFQVVEHLDVRGPIDVERPEIAVVPLQLDQVLVPDLVVVLDEGLELLAEHLLALGDLSRVGDHQHGQIAAAPMKAPVPALARGQLQLLGRPHHAVAAVVDPAPPEHGRPRRYGVGAVEEPGVVLLQVGDFVELERRDLVSPHVFPLIEECVPLLPPKLRAPAHLLLAAPS